MQDSKHKGSLPILMLAALGIVYGDIGTSPLYAIRECFHHSLNVARSPENVLGVLSLITWALIIMVSVKYILYITRADNKGEGGILALIALVSPHRQRRSTDKVKYVIPIGIFGAALLIGDGMITPAISVLSAVEGLQVATPIFNPYVLPATVAILVGIFTLQRQGTAKIGAIFGPIMVVWFTTLAGLGLSWVLQVPQVLQALSPHHALWFFFEHGRLGFIILGSVVLAVTGGEALYTDMGHLGRRPIKYAWFLMVLPALLLNYYGQGALLILNPQVENPFYELAPKWATIPLVVLSTTAAVIASQALISGMFSIARQAIQLGYIPRMNIIHTSRHEIGQIYIPMVNWTLMLSTIYLVLFFKTSSNLASAYGVAVTGTMVATTILAYFVVRRNWGWRKLPALAFSGFFLIFDLSFFSSTLLKVPEGGWFPMVVAVLVYFLMSTWQRGRAIVAERMRRNALPIAKFVQDVARQNPLRVPGIAVFMTSDPDSTPAALVHNLKHNKILHERLTVLSITTSDEPYVRSKDRIEFEALTPNFYRIVAKYGFMQTPNIFEILEAAKKKGFDYVFEDITFFLGRETILPSRAPGMSIWRERVFAFMLRNAQRATAFFQIPPDQVIEVGMQVEI